jgi:HEPN domain-containing protein
MNSNYNNWFKKEENDLQNVIINLNVPEFPADTVCYHCQQAAEKYFKGYLSFCNFEIEKTHNLNFLLQQCIDINSTFNQITEITSVLNLYGPSIRYPDFIEEPSQDDAREAYDYALKVKEFVLSVL